MNGKELLQSAVEKLGKEKRLEAELLLCDVLQMDRARFLAHDLDEVTQEQEKTYQGLITRMEQHEPFQYLLGTANFMGLDLKVTPSVLIPRFDTERLVETALRYADGIREPKILDICTGSGAIAIAMSHFCPNAQVWAGDLSEEALAVAKENNRTCQTSVMFRQGDLLEPFSDLKGTVDILVSNPPYITSDEMKELPEDVLQEPHMALWGGEDGLDFYHRLAEGAGALLRKGGWIVFEIGWKQGQAVQDMLEQQGFQDVGLLQDWQGRDRVVFGRK